MKPVLLAFLAAAIWGLWWIPIRYLETQGLTGALGGLVMNTGAFLAAAVWALAARRPLRLHPKAALGAVLVGVAVATYSSALNYGDVVRVILLFYLAPAWSKIIEWAFMGMGWGKSSTLALVAALSGAVLILGGDVTGAALRIGDVLAVLSGLAWAAGSALIFTSGRAGVLPLTLMTALSAVLVALLFAGLSGPLALTAGMASAASLGAGFGVIYVLPILALTLWSAQRLSPAVLSFLLTAEILTGVGSGAVLLNEPFGWVQIAGSALILAGALSEVLPTLFGPARRT
jgi:drug/metabolite transporter (DMT)-like permease